MSEEQKIKKPRIKEGFALVTRTTPGMATTTKEKKLSVRVFATETAEIGAQFGRTIQTKEFSFVKVGVYVQMPCYVEEMPSVAKTVVAFAKNMIEQEVQEITNHGKETNTITT